MTRRGNFWATITGIFFTFLILLSACGPSGLTPVGNTGQPKFGGTVVDGLFGEPDNLLTGLSNSAFSNLVKNTFLAPLIYTDNNGLLQPGLLTQIPSIANGGISSDFKTFTLKLRPNLKWSDGSPLTAQDVVFTINLLRNPDYGTKTSFEGNEIASVIATDATTIVLVLKKVDVAFLSFSLTDVSNFAPLPMHIFGSMNPKNISQSPQAFMPTFSSGPFKIVDRKSGDHITVVKNSNYYLAPKPYLDKITFQIIPNQNTILTALQSGSIDTSWFLDINKLNDYKAISGYKIYTDKSPGNYEMIAFNLYSSTKNILADLNVRKAIKLGIDTGPIIQNIWKGTAVPTCDDAPGTFAHVTDLIPCNKQDPAAAGQLLDQAGWVMGSDGYRHKGGKILELRYSTTQDKTYRTQTEQIVQSQLKDIGIKIDIVNYTDNTLFGTIVPNGTFDIVEYASAPISGDPDNHGQWDCDQFPAAGGFNVMHWCDQRATTADKAALSNPNQNYRKQQYHILYQEINQQVPAMFYYAFGNISVANAKIQNYSPGPFGPGETVECWNWWRTDAK